MRDGYAFESLYFGLDRLNGLGHRAFEREGRTGQSLDIDLDYFLINAIHPSTKQETQKVCLKWPIIVHRGTWDLDKQLGKQ